MSQEDDTEPQNLPTDPDQAAEWASAELAAASVLNMDDFMDALAQLRAEAEAANGGQG